ncbi:hypothetical protein [Shewanella sp.]|uniref:hypothetical protein n=1 Tax=Shewanella sp. TaxID=50422 RepID=UPI003F3694F8
MTTTTPNPFTLLNQTTTASFNEQKQLIKRVLQGKSVQCPQCKQALTVILPEKANAAHAPGIYCAKGCTDIELDMEAVAQR